MEPSCLHERKKAQLSLHTASRFAYIFLVRILYVRKRPLISKPTKKTLTHIKQHPGIRYRQLLRLSGFANGVLSFHLNLNLKFKIVRAKKLGYSTTRYYPTGSPSAFDSKKDYFFLEHSNCRFKEIVQYIERAPSTTSFQLQHLENTRIISVMRAVKTINFIS